MMTLNTDALIVLTGTLSFIIFLLLHFIAFRSLKAEHLFKGIILTFLAALGLELFISIYFLKMTGFLSLFLSVTIYALMAFFYILCIFGPYETSIRMRLIREISKDPQGKTFAEIVKLYNERVILNNRLQRLLGSGDVRLENGRYFLGKNNNAFFILDSLAGYLHAFIHKT